VDYKKPPFRRPCLSYQTCAGSRLLTAPVHPMQVPQE
jgi:hypothetical protein